MRCIALACVPWIFFNVLEEGGEEGGVLERSEPRGVEHAGRAAWAELAVHRRVTCFKGDLLTFHHLSAFA